MFLRWFAASKPFEPNSLIILVFNSLTQGTFGTLFRHHFSLNPAKQCFKKTHSTCSWRTKKDNFRKREYLLNYLCHSLWFFAWKHPEKNPPFPPKKLKLAFIFLRLHCETFPNSSAFLAKGITSFQPLDSLSSLSTFCRWQIIYFFTFCFHFTNKQTFQYWEASLP